MLKPTNAQSISRVLRRNGFNPHGPGDSLKRHPALQCKRSGNEVRVRVWSNLYDETPTAGDYEVAAEIAELLRSNDYKIRYTDGDYFLYVTGKEV